MNKMNTLITYDVVSDKGGKLRSAAKIACQFWNRFLYPKQSIVTKLGTFTSAGFVIARAYRPFSSDNTTYGLIEFNTKYMEFFEDDKIAGTVIHELGHTLGMGWSKWMQMFDPYTGEFKTAYINELPHLQYMLVETGHGPGTQYAHWDEDRFDLELMTGFKDPMEYVLPVTIKVMRLLGHTIIEELTEKTNLIDLIAQADDMTFSRGDEVAQIDKSYHVITDVMEELYI